MKNTFKSMQPKDWHPKKVKFPCIIQPKVDGVASYNRYSKMLGRSLKPHENKFTTEFFSKENFHGFCGEFYNTELGATHPDLCRITSGDLRRHEGEPPIKWILFDYCTDETKDLPYYERMHILEEIVKNLPAELRNLVEVIESCYVSNMEELLAKEAEYLALGYEGACIRDPNLPFKYGDCGSNFMGCWRIKRMQDFEILVDKINEGFHNANEAKTNERGRTERSTHQENMQPNGLLGSMEGTVIKDVFDAQTGKLLLKQGDYVKVSPGEMDLKQRKYYWDNPDEIVKHIVKAKLFPKGMKDLPRFPVYLSHRNSNDL